MPWKRSAKWWLTVIVIINYYNKFISFPAELVSDHTIQQEMSNK